LTSFRIDPALNSASSSYPRPGFVCPRWKDDFVRSRFEYYLVKCFRGERSQLVNKRLALTRLAALFAGEQAEKEKQFRRARRETVCLK
jgi:hypothetical protein